MADLRAAYLIHGDDHGAITERRARLRALALSGLDGAAGVELLEGDSASPAGVASALASMTLTVERRVIIVEGAERWREEEVKRVLAPALAEVPPQTTLAVFAREEARAKAPPSLHAAVKRAGGQILAHMTVKPWELPRWVREQAAQLGVTLDAAAAKALVAQVGERQQRLLRELEKLALEANALPAAVSAEDVAARAAHSSEWRAYALADALVGADGPAAVRSYLRLREQGERLSGLTYLMASRLRDALALALRLQAGEPTSELKRTLRMPARAAERFIADVARSEPERLRRALETIAELELDTRGGAPLSSARRRSLAGLEEDTLALRALDALTSTAG